MNEATWIIIIGLGFDIVGAFLIVKSILFRFKKVKDNGQGAKTSDYVDKNIYEPNYEFRSTTQVKIGMIILAIGFILQIIGNWFQNPPF